MSSEDSDFIDAYARPVSGGKKKASQACRMNVQALVMLKKLKWDVRTAPFQAELSLYDGANACGGYMSRNTFEYPLCGGKVTLMAPVIDPNGANCEIVFFEEIVINRASVRLCDVITAIWQFYSNTEPSKDLIETLTSLLANGAAGMTRDVANKHSEIVTAYTQNLVVPQSALLKETVYFNGLIPWDDGTYYVNLVTAKGASAAKVLPSKVMASGPYDFLVQRLGALTI